MKIVISYTSSLEHVKVEKSVSSLGYNPKDKRFTIMADGFDYATEREFATDTIYFHSDTAFINLKSKSDVIELSNWIDEYEQKAQESFLNT